MVIQLVFMFIGTESFERLNQRNHMTKSSFYQVDYLVYLWRFLPNTNPSVVSNFRCSNLLSLISPLLVGFVLITLKQGLTLNWQKPLPIYTFIDQAFLPSP